MLAVKIQPLDFRISTCSFHVSLRSSLLCLSVKVWFQWRFGGPILFTSIIRPLCVCVCEFRSFALIALLQSAKCNYSFRRLGLPIHLSQSRLTHLPGPVRTTTYDWVSTNHVYVCLSTALVVYFFNATTDACIQIHIDFWFSCLTNRPRWLVLWHSCTFLLTSL